MSKFGIALGGGGARGLAHIGVLKALESAGIKINYITGCSMGAVVGGLYAYFGNAKQVEKFMLGAIKNPKFIIHKKINNKDKRQDKNFFKQFFDYIEMRLQALKSLSRLSYFDDASTKKIYELIPDVTIESLKIKYSAVATDLLSGDEINFTKGSLRNAIRASSAIPGIFPPVKYQNYFLVDGSASGSVPAGKVKEIGADRVLAIDVTRNLKVVQPLQNVLELLYRTEDITSFHLSVLRLREADLVIRPQVGELSWTDFDKAKEIIRAGEIIMQKNINKIKQLANRNIYLLQIEHYIKKLKDDT
jgi:NTE family protein